MLRRLIHGCPSQARAAGPGGMLRSAAAARGRASEVDDIILKLCGEAPDVRPVSPQSMTYCAGKLVNAALSRVHAAADGARSRPLRTMIGCHGAGHHTEVHPGMRARLAVGGDHGVHQLTGPAAQAGDVARQRRSAGGPSCVRSRGNKVSGTGAYVGLDRCNSIFTSLRWHCLMWPSSASTKLLPMASGRRACPQKSC